MTSEPLPPGLCSPGVMILSGPFGSGKTEIAINLARRWALDGPTYLADLDVVTPYYRPRDQAEALAGVGVRVLTPEGPAAVYDTPVLPPEMGGAVTDEGSGLIVDVGGQPHGAGVLAHWQEGLLARDAKMCLVVNPRRPGAEDTPQVLALAAAISEASGLSFAGIIANGNLGRMTTPDDVVSGISQGREVGRTLGIPLLAACYERALEAKLGAAAQDVPGLPLQRFMRPPWEAASGMT